MARQHAKQPEGARTERGRTRTGIEVGDRVRAKTTVRTGEVTHVEQDGDRQHLTVSYDHEPQDEYLTTPAREGTQLPIELVDRVDGDGETIRAM
jgi:hypothetical protein